MKKDYEKIELHGGRAVLYRGDCFEIMADLEAVDAVITDPPYASGGMYRGDRCAPPARKYEQGGVKAGRANFSHDAKDQRAFMSWCSEWMQRMPLKDGGYWLSFIDWRQLREFRESLLVGDRSPLGVDARAAAAERQFADVARRAALGDTDAMERLQSASEDYLDTSREAAASAEEYYRAFARVQGALLKSEGVASRQEQIAQQQLDVLTAQVGALIEINGNVMSVRDAIAALHAARGTAGSSGSAQAGAANGGTSGNAPKDQSADALPSGPWLDALPPGLQYNWAVQSPELKGLTAKQLQAYFERERQRQAGQIPAFAAGGQHYGGLRLVGERGPELEVTGPARYYSAQQTQQMLAGGDNNALIREIAALRAEVRDLRAAASATARQRSISAPHAGMRP